MSTVIVTGGAGYIGAEIVKTFIRAGYTVVSIDYHAQEQNDSNYISINADIRNIHTLYSIFEKYTPIDCVIHCAGELGIERSFQEKNLFYNQIVYATDCVISAVLKYHVPRIIFSSSAAVYTESAVPIAENVRLFPSQMAPYSYYKYMCEQKIKMLGDEIDYCIFRYFNVIGCDISSTNSIQAYLKSKNIIPTLIIAAHEKKTFYVNGNDHATFDGTCERDYISVQDLAELHIKAYCCMKKETWNESDNDIYNVGTGYSYSVYEMVKFVEEITGMTLEIENKSKRHGDVPFLCANNMKTKKKFNWEPKKDAPKVIAELWNVFLET